MSTKKSDIFLDAVIERIKKALGLRFDADIAQTLGMDRRTLAGYKSRASIPYEQLILFAIKNGYSLDWLFFGQGEMFDSNISEEGGRYNSGFDFDLYHTVTARVRTLLSEEGLTLTDEKFDRLVGAAYDETLKSNRYIDDKKILYLIKMAS